MRDMEKACTKCGEVKLLEDFVVKNRNKSGRAAHCKECDNALQKKFRKDYPEKKAASAKKYREKNRNEILASKKEYREKFPEKGVAERAKRRAAQLEQIPSWSNDDDLEAIKKVYENCRLMSILTGIPHEVDHIIPMQGEDIRGFHHSTNLAIIPASLNASKSNKWEFQEVNYG